jgi:hypothetical protein
VFKTILRNLTGFSPNKNMDHAVESCKELLSTAKHSIHIVAGDLDSELFENPAILDMLRTLATRKHDPVSIQILYGPTPDTKTHELYKMAKDVGITLIRLPVRPNGHFIVVDGKHTRVEEYHEQGAPERKAYMAYNTLFLADKLEGEFEDIKSEATAKVV